MENWRQGRRGHLTEADKHSGEMAHVASFTERRGTILDAVSAQAEEAFASEATEEQSG